MARNQALKRFTALVEEHGMTVEHGTKHMKVLKNGRRVGTLATSGEINACRQAVRDLDRQGLFGLDGKEARKVTF